MNEITGKWAEFTASPYFWDFITLGCGFVSVLGGLWLVVLVLGLPGRIAIARNHPDAEAIYAMGWVGFAAIVPWIQALIWAFKPTDKVDIRYFPQAERVSEQQSMEHLTAYAYGKKRRPPERDAAIDAAIDREAGLARATEAAPTQHEPNSAPRTPDADPTKQGRE
ncbi:superinfection immunity protein [Pseudoruegeria sp. SK021]|uniref:superinfection immunity protein n=1 Tax=Pseudoruegeria sp. SK021 TaxID=1933035 RepID=UPI000A219241|nr:superinfection immunity protein [Pseudoruegeria sp. SK021]OSP54023.1 hypothetical protein BV911_14935 [Pseudoruegeria sp. SK021]